MNRIKFPNKIEVNVNNENPNFITGKNINEIKTVVNEAIFNIENNKNSIDTLNTNTSLLSSLYDEIISSYILSSEYINEINKINGSLSTIIIEDTTKNQKINTLKNDTYKLKLTTDKISGLLYNLNDDFILASNELNKLKNDTFDNFYDLNLRTNDLEKNINENAASIKNINFKNNIYYSNVETKFLDFDNLKAIVNNNIKKIQSIEDNFSNSILNNVIMDNTNILYFLDQCRERLYLQDMRTDHLERMIRHIEDHKDWDDWHRLFSMLNLLKLKLARLSLFRHVNMKDIFFDDEELKDFKHILNEIELKLNNFTTLDLENIDIDKEKIMDIMDNIDNVRSLDVGDFEFYPNYPDSENSIN